MNGSRLPWNFWLNLKVDKQFALTKPEAKRQLGLNVFVRIQNVLDRQNIIRVYTATGSSEDDGFLVSPEGVAATDNILSTGQDLGCLLYTSPSPRDRQKSRMPSSA